MHSENLYIRHLADTCYQSGIRDVVICPGSRSAPLVFAFQRYGAFRIEVVSDERSAGFIALGIAQQTQRAVVVICTSGSASVNLYPAVVEAFYQQIPLFIMSADRPESFLHQQDGQMIDQKNLFGVHVGAHLHADKNIVQDSSGALLNEALLPLIQSLTTYSLPVHANLPFQEPLYPPVDIWEKRPRIAHPTNSTQTESEVWQAAKGVSSIILLAGLMPVDPELQAIIRDLQSFPQIVVLSDITSNISGIRQFDTILEDPALFERLKPELIISFGGPCISKNLKNALRKTKPAKHIRIQTFERAIDTYGHSPEYVYSHEKNALNQLKDVLMKHSITSNYQRLWQEAEQCALDAIQHALQHTESAEIHSLISVIGHLSPETSIQFANSSVIRYAVLLNDVYAYPIHCNRGTSGIDGSVSTAVGAASRYAGSTLLVTGDTSFFYDRNAFWNQTDRSRLKIVLINNGGGGIFGLIDGPVHEPEFERYFYAPHALHARSLCAEFGIRYFCVDSPSEALPEAFFEEQTQATLLEIFSDASINQQRYLQLKKHIQHEFKQRYLGKYSGV